jgi:hypothetical protein
MRADAILNRYCEAEGLPVDDDVEGLLMRDDLSVAQGE